MALNQTMKNTVNMLRAKFFTVKEIADLLAVNEVTVRNLIKNGELRAIKLEREFRIAKIDLEAFLNRHATSNEPKSE